METIAILEALLKWEDKLLGQRILVVTDHKALEFFKTQRHLSNRQARWMEFLVCFDYDITYVKGKTNLVADTLSRYHENDHWDEATDKSQYVNADLQLDPEGEDLPWVHFEETRAMCKSGVDPHSCPQRQRRAPRKADEPVSFTPKHPIVEAIEERQRDTAALAAHEERGRSPVPAPLLPLDDSSDPTVKESLGHLLDLRP